ncbi:MAG: class I SAM-dependent methyltransferase [Bacteroidetes bacterium]|nr:MAG: class I SAM-dependent methyltransferase [Bacteroidota bacterium]
MSNQIHYTLCPVCGSAGISEVFKVKDNTVSQEYFEIDHCRNCQVRFTQNPPSEATIASYYKSEDYISHTDTSKGLINRLYRFVRNFSLNQKKKLVEKEIGLKKGNLLDVGSGTGHFASAMKKAGWRVTGLEPDEGARAVASKEHSIELLPSSELFNLPEKKFNAITLWHVLEHVHDVKNYIQTFKKLLVDTGRLFIAVPNYTSYDAEKYKAYWAAYDVPRHLYHFTPQTMQWLMKECGLKIVDVKPMWFDSFYVSLLSSKYKNGNTKWIGAFWTGLISNFKAIGDAKKCSSVIYIVGVLRTK